MTAIDSPIARYAVPGSSSPRVPSPAEPLAPHRKLQIFPSPRIAPDRSPPPPPSTQVTDEEYAKIVNKRRQEYGGFIVGEDGDE